MTSFLGGGAYEYPPQPAPEQEFYGIYPVDFLLETVLKAGLQWFRTDPMAPKFVFGHLMSPYLAKYGEAKINEIADYIRKYDVKIIQHWSLIHTSVPCISIQLLDAGEMVERTGLTDFQRMVDTKNAEGDIVGRRDVGYSPITDNIHLGIHCQDTPDLAKYLYYLVTYILNAFKPQLETQGLMLGTFRATDLSRMNEYLPENLYSRFINFTVFTLASFDKGVVPIIEEIMGVHVSPSSQANPGLEPTEEIDTNYGVSICIGDENE